jgi:hypothetical protein
MPAVRMQFIETASRQELAIDTFSRYAGGVAFGIPQLCKVIAPPQHA